MTDDATETWHFANREEGQWISGGPITRAQLRDMISAGKITAASLLWESRHDRWMTPQDAGIDVAAWAAPTAAAVPPPLPLNQTPPPLPAQALASEPVDALSDVAGGAWTSSQVGTTHPWPRFWARFFDYQLVGMPLAMLAMIIVVLLIPSLMASLQSMSTVASVLIVTNLFVTTVLIVTLTPIFEAAMLATFGTTPGKARCCYPGHCL